MSEFGDGRPAAKASAAPNSHTKHEKCFLHGTLFVQIRSAANLGRSAAVEDAQGAKRDLAHKLGHGARFVGKKMLNAVRATNNVRYFVMKLVHFTLFHLYCAAERLTRPRHHQQCHGVVEPREECWCLTQ